MLSIQNYIYIPSCMVDYNKLPFVFFFLLHNTTPVTVINILIITNNIPHTTPTDTITCGEYCCRIIIRNFFIHTALEEEF